MYTTNVAVSKLSIHYYILSIMFIKDINIY